jgi:hypothetical protein
METARSAWRLVVVGYLVWLILFAVVEGAGRQACRVPTARWIAAAADARDRTARLWFRDRAGECLGYTRWYRYSTIGLLGAGPLVPLTAVWMLRRRVRRPAMVAAAACLVGLGVTVGTAWGVRWLYDWCA